MSENRTTQELIAQLDEIVRIQCTDGNWNWNPYMHGMANGLLLAAAIMHGVEYKPIDRPDQWLENDGSVRGYSLAGV